MRTVEVNVTAEDIRAGIPCRTCHCPVALAMSRALGRRMDVGYRYACPYSEPSNRTRLPDWLWFWIVEYDRGGPVDPVAFVVEVPDMQ